METSRLRLLASIMIVIMFGSWCWIPTSVNAQEETFHLMSLADGTKITITKTQFVELISEPGVELSGSSLVSASQISVPLPIGLGGGFLNAEPAVLASALNNVGVSSGITASSFGGASAGAGTITVGQAAGAAITSGIGAGTIAVGALLAAGVIGVAAAAGGSGGGGSDGGTTSVHTTTRH